MFSLASCLKYTLATILIASNSPLSRSEAPYQFIMSKSSYLKRDGVKLGYVLNKNARTKEASIHDTERIEIPIGEKMLKETTNQSSDDLKSSSRVQPSSKFSSQFEGNFLQCMKATRLLSFQVKTSIIPSSIVT